MSEFKFIAFVLLKTRMKTGIHSVDKRLDLITKSAV